MIVNRVQLFLHRFVRLPLTLRNQFLVVILLTMVPVLTFAVLMVVLYGRQEREAVLKGLENTTRALTVAVDEEFMSSIGTLQALGTSEYLDSGDLAHFRRLCERMLPTQSWFNLLLSDVTGREVVNLRTQVSELELPTTGGLHSFHEVLRTRRPAIQSYMQGRLIGAAVGVSVPVLREGRVKYVLTAAFLPEVLRQILERQNFPDAWKTAIIDTNDIVIATTDAQRAIGQPTELRMEQTGSFQQKISGTHSYVALSKSPVTGWAVAVFTPSANLDAALHHSTWAVTGVGVGFVALGLVVSVLLTKKITAPVEALSSAAKALGKGEPLASVPPSPIFELNQLGQAITCAADLLHQRSLKRDRIEETLRGSEEQIRAINKRLEMRIAERTEELKIANEIVRQKEALATIGTTVAKLAHDIGNPLNIMAADVYLLEGYLAEHPDPEISSRVRDLGDEIARLGNLIDEMRKISRPMKLELGPVNVAQLAEKVAREAALTIPHTQPIKIEERLSSDLPPVLADFDKLRQAVLNLVKNALEAMPQGGTLTIRGFIEKNRVCLEIQDTGIGIPKDMNPFELFITSKPQGWGLGLASVQQIVMAQNGTIDYRSESGLGTTFRISLPVALPEAAVATAG